MGVVQGSLREGTESDTAGHVEKALQLAMVKANGPSGSSHREEVAVMLPSPRSDKK